jgi:hypothetical protein
MIIESSSKKSNRIGIVWVAITNITASTISEGKHGRHTPAKKINAINNYGRHRKSYPLMSDQCVANIQSTKDLTNGKVAQTAQKNCSSCPWSDTVPWLNILGDLAIDSKEQYNVSFMQAPICQNFTRQKVFNATSARESIYKFNDVKHHMDNHNARYHREW